MLLHLGLAQHRQPIPTMAALAILQVGCALLLAGTTRRGGGTRLPWVLLPLVPCLAWPACAVVPHAGIVATLLATHVILYGGLTALFGQSLLPGREPLVSAMAREVEPQFTPRMRLYTRQVTWFWTLYGPAQITVSLLLLMLAPVRAWSVFVNLLDLPLLGGALLAEFAFRRWWLRGETHARFADGWRAARRRWSTAG